MEVRKEEFLLGEAWGQMACSMGCAGSCDNQLQWPQQGAQAGAV